MEFKIREYHPGDLSSLYRICLLTGNNGEDASGLFDDPDLNGHYYAAPYAVLEPDLCFILTQFEKPVGYILGTRDSDKFYEMCEEKWFPPLRKKYKLEKLTGNAVQDGLIRMIHAGHKIKNELLDYPAHLHIDILPSGQGRGLGRQLMDVFLNKLKSLNVPAVHLEVEKANKRAVNFYQHSGFFQIKEYEIKIAFGKVL